MPISYLSRKYTVSGPMKLELVFGTNEYREISVIKEVKNTTTLNDCIIKSIPIFELGKCLVLKCSYC